MPVWTQLKAKLIWPKAVIGFVSESVVAEIIELSSVFQKQLFTVAALLFKSLEDENGLQLLFIKSAPHKVYSL